MDDGRKPVGYKPRALDGGYGWVVVLGSFLIHVFADGFVYSFGVIAESLIKEFNSTNTEVSSILSLLTGLMLATGPLASAVCNRIGCRITTIVGALIASIGCALSYFATSMGFLIFSVGIVMGTGFGLMYCPAIVIVTIYFEKYRALATGITVCGAGVGTFVFSKIIAILIEEFEWRTVFIIYAGVVLLCVPCGALYRPVEFVPIYENEEDEAVENEKKEEGKRPDEEKTRLQHDDHHLETALLRTDDFVNGRIRPAQSHQLIDQVSGAHEKNGAGGGFLQRFLSIGDRLNVEEGRQSGKRNGAISVSTGYLNIRDVFYPGSITELPEYKENKARFRSVSSLHSHSSANRGNTSAHVQAQYGAIRRIEEERDEEVENDLSHYEGNKLVESSPGKSSPEREGSTASRAIEVWRTIKRILDLNLLADPIYLLFGISNFFTSIGFNAPPMFMPMNAEIVLGWNKIQASSTVAAYGLANTFGRIAFGLICDRSLPFRWGRDRARNRLWIYNLTLMLCGLLSALVFAFTTYPAFIAYCFFFGFTISSYVCLTSVVLVDLVGVDRLTNAFGLLLFIQGIATFVGPPLAGKLYDLTNRYDWTFAFCGVCLFISGVMLFLIPWFHRRENNKTNDDRLKGNGKRRDTERELLPASANAHIDNHQSPPLEV